MVNDSIRSYGPKSFATAPKRAREAYMIGAGVATYHLFAAIPGEIMKPEVLASYARDIAVEYGDNFLLDQIDRESVTPDYLQKYKDSLFNE